MTIKLNEGKTEDVRNIIKSRFEGLDLSDHRQRAKPFVDGLDGLEGLRLCDGAPRLLGLRACEPEKHLLQESQITMLLFPSSVLSSFLRAAAKRQAGKMGAFQAPGVAAWRPATPERPAATLQLPLSA